MVASIQSDLEREPTGKALKQWRPLRGDWECCPRWRFPAGQGEGERRKRESRVWGEKACGERRG